MNLKSFLTAFISTNNKHPKKPETLSQPVLSEYTEHDPPLCSTFEAKLRDYYKATYVMYAKLHEDTQKSLAEKYQDYIDIQALRKDILSYSEKKAG
ncbi:hypothetical protein [Marinicella sp. W31]|uniref:hypothetical protein n=1 Tax=Marinicella sp. W31 TaxID=3023713 RepID=UPI003756CEA8